MIGARPGDWVISGRRSYNRRGLIVAVYHADGSPPYLICWSDDGREALFEPGPDCRLVPAADWRPDPD